MQYFRSMCHYGIIFPQILLILGGWIFSNDNGIGLVIKSLYICILWKNSNARIRDWIQDRVVTITQSVIDQQDNIVYQVEHWVCSFIKSSFKISEVCLITWQTYQIMTTCCFALNLFIIALIFQNKIVMILLLFFWSRI